MHGDGETPAPGQFILEIGVNRHYGVVEDPRCCSQILPYWGGIGLISEHTGLFMRLSARTDDTDRGCTFRIESDIWISHYNRHTRGFLLIHEGSGHFSHHAVYSTSIVDEKIESPSL